jgi:uncharacterized membrane protein
MPSQDPATAPRRDEEGAMAIMAALATVVALLAAVLAIDLGSHVLAQRDMQGAVDLAALDAVMALDADGEPSALADQYARDSLTRNDGWANRDGRTVTVTVGTFDRATRVFTPTTSAPDAVLVEAEAQFSRLTGVLAGSDRVAHTAVASLLEASSISIGTHVASLDTGRSELLNRVMGRLFDGPVTIDAVGWQGMADAQVPLRALMTSFNVASVEQLLDLQVTAPQLLEASAAGLSSSGDPLEVQTAGLLTSTASTISNQTTFRLGDLLVVEQGVPGSVATLTVDALSLVTGSAMMINDDRAVDLGMDLSGVPGVGSGSLTLAVVEPPQVAVGRPGLTPGGEYRTIARTAQVRLGVDLELDPLGEYAGVNVGSMRLPLALDAGRGSAALLDVGCAADEAAAFATNLVRTTAAGVVYGATSPEVLVAPSASVVGSVRGPLVDLTVDTLLAGEVPVASVTAAGSEVVPGADEQVQLYGPFASRARVLGNAPLGGFTGDGVGLSTLLDDLDLETTLLESSPTLGLTLSIDGDGTSVSLTDDVLVPALADAAGVVDGVDALVADVVDVLGVATVGDADTSADTVDCSGRQLVQ